MGFIDLTSFQRGMMIAAFMACAAGYMAATFLCWDRCRNILHCLKYALLATALFLLDSYLIEAHNAVYNNEISNSAAYAVSLGLVSAPLYIFILVIAVSVFFIAIAYEVYKLNNSINASSIRYAIDNMPMGVCFASKNGRPYLINHAMYEAAMALTGKNLYNINSLWKKVEERENHLFVRNDGKAWKFEREIIDAGGEEIVQIKAVDVTDLSHITTELQNSRAELEGHRKMLTNMMETMVESQKQEEILSSKVKIHDSLGRAVIMTRWRAWGEKESVNEDALIKTWFEIIEKMKSGFEDEKATGDIMAELNAAAAMLDCKICLMGELPENEETAYLVVSAAREALTNAIKHAGADTIYVLIERKALVYSVTIYDNGTAKSEEISEGGGLSGLRKKIEKDGSKMIVESEDGKVIIKLELIRKE